MHLAFRLKTQDFRRTIMSCRTIEFCLDNCLLQIHGDIVASFDKLQQEAKELCYKKSTGSLITNEVRRGVTGF